MSDLLGALFEGFGEFLHWQRNRPMPAPKDYSNDPEANASFKRLVESNPRFSDPVYQKNLQRLIERNRKFEENRE
jgi:hypothetical protein